MKSALIRKGTSAPPLREAALIVTIANHPAIGLAHFDEFEMLDCSHATTAKVHAVLLDIFANAGESDDQLTLDVITDAIEQAGFSETFQTLVAQVRNNRVWQALTDASFEDARDGWIQASRLHARSRALERELRDAEVALARDGDAHSFDRLVYLKQQLEDESGMDALIEGFGIASGRKASSF